MNQSSGINHLEIPSVEVLDSQGTKSTEMMITCEKQNQRSSRTKAFKDNLGLPLLVMPRRFMASTCKTTNLRLHWLTIDCKHSMTPKKLRYGLDGFRLREVLMCDIGEANEGMASPTKITSIRGNLDGKPDRGRPNIQLEP
jgi:hypothetical protein